MKKRFIASLNPLHVLIAGLALLGLYIISVCNYLIFHSLAELFSIVIAFSIFILVWNSEQFLEEDFLIFIGIAYLFVSGIDFLHIFAYKGMDVFSSNGSNLATQLWISARYMESISLLIAFLLPKRRMKIWSLMLGYVVVTTFLLGIIFYWRIFPDCYIEGIGLTPFKKISEYVISLILTGTVFLLFHKRDEINDNVFWCLITSLILTIASELSFTFYIDVYGLSNLSGHFLKILSFWFIYRAIIVTGLKRPYDLLFKNLKESERALQKEKERVQKYLNIARVILLVIDGDQRVSLINRKGCEILGYPKEVILGKNWFEHYLPKCKRERAQAVFMEWMRTSEKNFHEMSESPVLTENGEERMIEWHTILLRDEKGNISGALFSGEDITERKRAEKALIESEEKYHSIFETAASLIMILDAEGIILDCNQRLKDLLGYMKGEIIGHPLSEIIHQGDNVKVQSLLEKISSNGSVLSGEYKMVRKDGTLIDIMLNASSLKIDLRESNRFICIIDDISELKEAEKRLEHYASRLQSSNEEIRRFACIVSHDLMSPLVNLKGFTKELRSSFGLINDIMTKMLPHLTKKRRQALTAALKKDIPEDLGFIESSVSRMDNLINAVLKLSRLGHFELDLETIDMNELVQDLLKTLAHQIEENQVKVNIGNLPGLIADRISMEQIMGNILTNAVTYIDSNRSLQVEITGEDNGAEKIFHIRDTGRGIAPEDMDKIFVPFRRAGKQDIHGEGMGLAYVHTLIRRHGGRIWCESELGVGTIFTFTISNHLRNSVSYTHSGAFERIQ